MEVLYFRFNDSNLSPETRHVHGFDQNKNLRDFRSDFAAVLRIVKPVRLLAREGRWEGCDGAEMTLPAASFWMFALWQPSVSAGQIFVVVRSFASQPARRCRLFPSASPTSADEDFFEAFWVADQG